jgi:hypothetical protein
VAAVCASSAARAADVQVAGKPLEIDVTNTSILNHHFDNENTQPKTPATRDDDNYNEWINRFNLQLSYWRFSAAVRFDSYLASRLSDSDITTLVQKDVATTAATSADQLALTNAYKFDLNTKYLPTFYPSKLWITYQQPGIEATVGDFYVQLGRGLVFSVRKIDELSIDTTVRGGKLALDRQFGPVHVDLLGFAGQMNPLRIDETSGRRLNVMGDDPLFFGFPTAQSLQTTQLTNNIAVEQTNVAQPNYLEDAAYGGRLEVGPKEAHVAFNGAVVRRKSFDLTHLQCLKDGGDEVVSGPSVAPKISTGNCNASSPSFSQIDPTLEHDTIRNFSGSLNVPSIFGHGDLYVEVAGQQLRDGQITSLNPDGSGIAYPNMSGYAVYVAASLRAGPVSASFEGKHYRSFFPILANVDTSLGDASSAAPEFNNVAYSQPPTAQSIYIEPASGAAPNDCITGGRTIVTYRLTPRVSVFAWLGRFVSWTEIEATNFNCLTRDPPDAGVANQPPKPSNETDTWDYAGGAEIFLEGGKSKLNFYVGAIEQSLADPHDPLGGPASTTFYREGYLRYDVVKHIAGPFSIQMQGWHRRRYEPFTQQIPWWEGENYAALQWSPHVSLIYGFEYLTQGGCQTGPILSPETGTVDQQTGMDVITAPVKGAAKDVCLFNNGGAQWRSNGMGGVVGQVLDTVNVFVGERRGALRCVSGVCRQFPPFSGAKLEIVSRF